MKKAIGCLKGGTREKKVISAYCAANEMEVTEWLTIGDSGFSAITYMDWQKGKKADAVVVADSKNVSQNIYEYYANKCLLWMKNVELVTVEDSFTGYKLIGKILEEFTETICKIDSENRPARKNAGRSEKIAKGGYIGGRAPMGYRSEDGKLVINPEEVPVVKLIFERKHNGNTMLGTVEALNNGGYKTRNGGKFQISTVQGIWHNEQFYKGYRKDENGEWIKGQHEPMIEE